MGARLVKTADPVGARLVGAATGQDELACAKMDADYDYRSLRHSVVTTLSIIVHIINMIRIRSIVCIPRIICTVRNIRIPSIICIISIIIPTS